MAITAPTPPGNITGWTISLYADAGNRGDEREMQRVLVESKLRINHQKHASDSRMRISLLSNA